MIKLLQKGKLTGGLKLSNNYCIYFLDYFNQNYIRPIMDDNFNIEKVVTKYIFFYKIDIIGQIN